MSSSTHARDAAINHSKRDPAGGLTLARRVPDPWFRVQALAYAGWYAEACNAPAIVRECLNVARSCTDLFQAVAVCAWPLKLAVEHGCIQQFYADVRQLCNRLDRITPGSSQSEAALKLLAGVIKAEPDCWIPVLRKLVLVSDPPDHWRKRRNLRDALLEAARYDRSIVDRLVGTLSEGKAKRQIVRNLDEPRHRGLPPILHA